MLSRRPRIRRRAWTPVNARNPMQKSPTSLQGGIPAESESSDPSVLPSASARDATDADDTDGRLWAACSAARRRRRASGCSSVGTQQSAANAEAPLRRGASAVRRTATGSVATDDDRGLLDTELRDAASSSRRRSMGLPLVSAGPKPDAEYMKSDPSVPLVMMASPLRINSMATTGPRCPTRRPMGAKRDPADADALANTAVTRRLPAASSPPPPLAPLLKRRQKTGAPVTSAPPDTSESPAM